MKTLRAIVALRYYFIVLGVVGVVLLLFGGYAFRMGDTGGAQAGVIFAVLCFLLGVIIDIIIYPTHWIKYGNGRVAISRISKESVNGRPTGKWKIRKNEFLLEEIDRYGLSKKVLGYDVEYYPDSSSLLKNHGVFGTEVFFQLKNGRRIGYEMECYMRKETDEFLRYIFKETGIPFQKEKGGYAIRDDGIFFQRGSVKNKLQFKEIKNIIISNHVLALKNKGIPYVVIVGEKEDEILRYCRDGERRHVLTRSNLRPRLYRKGSSTFKNYGFTWREEEMERVLEKYPGDYYIAASVLEYFGEKFDGLAKKYKISRERIHIIDDSTDGEFIWSER